MLDRDQLAQRLRRRAVVDGQTGCWLWQGALNKDGYGVLAWRLRERQRLLRVHRVALFVWAGQPLFGKAIVQCCQHSRRCFNPEHLVVLRRGGQPEQRCGAANGRAKLTEAEARLLLETSQRQALSPEELARLVGGKVQPATVEALLKGRTWRHFAAGTALPALSRVRGREGSGENEQPAHRAARRSARQRAVWLHAAGGGWACGQPVQTLRRGRQPGPDQRCRQPATLLG